MTESKPQTRATAYHRILDFLSKQQRRYTAEELHKAIKPPVPQGTISNVMSISVGAEIVNQSATPDHKAAFSWKWKGSFASAIEAFRAHRAETDSRQPRRPAKPPEPADPRELLDVLIVVPVASDDTITLPFSEAIKLRDTLNVMFPPS